MNIVITGASGFLGRQITDLLIRGGHRVWAVLRDENKTRILQQHNRLTVVFADMAQYSMLQAYISRADAGIALAWEGARGAKRRDASLQRRNFENNLELVRQLISMGCKKILLAGSQMEYGAVFEEKKVAEDHATNPDEEYGVYKLRLYKEAGELCKKAGVTLIDARIFSLYGVGDFAGTMVSSMLQRMLCGEICALSQCTQIWNFLYVEDAARAFEVLLDRGETGIYNVGNEHSARLRDYVEQMRCITGSQCTLHYGAIPTPERGLPNVNPDVTKLCSLGWKSQISFEDGIGIMIKALSRTVTAR